MKYLVKLNLHLLISRYQMSLSIRTNIQDTECRKIFRKLYLPVPTHPPGFVVWDESRVVLAYRLGIRSVIDLHSAWELESLTGVSQEVWISI